MHIEIFPIAEADVVTLVKSIDRVVINPVIFFLFAVAMVYFLYGLTRYFLSPDSTEVRDASKTQMIWGVLGLFIMVAVFGILQVIINTFGITNVKIQANGDYAVTIPDSTVPKNASLSLISAPNAPTYNLNNSLGSWDASNNNPLLTSGVGIKDSYYVVSKAGTTSVDGTSSWDVGDIVYYDGTKWVKKQNTTIVASSNPLVYMPLVNGSPATSPLKNNYVSDSLCWREAKEANSVSENKASQSIQNITRADYLSATGQSDQTAPTKFPLTVETQTLYDSTSKQFYVWLGVVAPIGTGQLSDCKILPTPTSESTKLNPFTQQYADTSTMYEAIDSAADPVLANAKADAIQNALIQIAQKEGLTSTGNISYQVIDGKYYPPDPTTQNYDYWVVVESPK